MVLEFLLSIDPIALRIGPLEVRWYGLAYLAGILLGLYYSKWIIKNYYEKNKLPLSTENIDEMNNVKFVKTTTTKDFEDKNLLYDVFSSLREKINAPVRKKTN